METLLEQFNTMRCMPIIEINKADYFNLDEDDYEVYTLTADETGIRTSGVFVPWDKDYCLDSHLELVLDRIVENLYKEV